jgi:hypothetical protein
MRSLSARPIAHPFRRREENRRRTSALIDKAEANVLRAQQLIAKTQTLLAKVSARLDLRTGIRYLGRSAHPAAQFPSRDP